MWQLNMTGKSRLPCPSCRTIHPPGSGSCLFRPTRGTPGSSSSQFTSDGKEICRNYNNKRCHDKECKWAHVCNSCEGPHQRTSCWRTQFSLDRRQTPRQWASGPSTGLYIPPCNISAHRIHTPLSVPRMRKLLLNHPNRPLVHFVMSGLLHGFDIGFRGSRDVNNVGANLSSAAMHPDFVSTFLAKCCKLNELLGPFTSNPFPLLQGWLHPKEKRPPTTDTSSFQPRRW